MVKKIQLTLVVCAMFAMTSLAQAVPMISGWQIDLSAAGQGLTGTMQNVNEITFAGLAHTHVEDLNQSGFPDPGELSVTDGILASTSFISSGGNLIPSSSTGEVNNFHFEVTFDFSIPTVFVPGGAGTNMNFDTVAPGTSVSGTPISGVLNIYVDNLQDGVGLQANLDPTAGGAGFADGALVASFTVVPGPTGTFRFATLDGSNDSEWVLTSAMPGVIIDANGDDLAIGTTIAFTDANFNLDTDSNGMIDSPMPANWPPFPGGNTGSGTPTDFFVTQNGSAFLAVPEPATLALLGLGGLFMARRRK